MYKKYYPKAISLKKLEQRVTKILDEYEIRPRDTLLSLSTCADEIERRIESQFQKHWGSTGFLFGGLAGIPFVGQLGFDACLSHVPDGGNLLLIYCSHVGITKKGNIGEVERRGIKKPTHCCGAAIYGYKKVVDEGQGDSLCVSDFNTFQENYIINTVYKNKKKFGNGEEKDMKILPDIIVKQISMDLQYPKISTKIVILGGININMRHKDYFHVKKFGILCNGEFLDLKDKLIHE